MRVWAGETTHVFSLCLFNRWSLGMQPLGPSLEIVTIWGYDLGIIPPLSHVQSSVSAGDVATVSQGTTAWIISIARTGLSMVHVHCVTRVSAICYMLHRSGWPVVIGVSPAIAPRPHPWLGSRSPSFSDAPGNWERVRSDLQIILGSWEQHGLKLANAISRHSKSLRD